jgi:deoxyribodipyrimidine photo-lyase
MVEGLEDLNMQLDNKLNLFYGNYLEVIKYLHDEHSCDAFFANTDYSPYAKKRDKDIYKYCKKQGLEFGLHHQVCLFPPGKIVKASDGKHYQKFTPFYNECLKHKPDKPLKPLEDGEMNFVKLDDAKMTIDFNETKKFYKFNDKLHVHCSRSAALEILNGYKAGTYDAVRNDLPGQKTTSGSGYFKFGSISIREAYHHWKKNGGGELQRQLIWRDFL